MSTQQEHSELVGGITQLYSGTVVECEAALAQQMANDLADAKRLEEEERPKAEMAK